MPQQETKPSTKQLAPTDPILGPEHLLKTGFAQKGLPSTIGCLPSGLYKARNGQIVAQTGPDQEIIPLSGMYFFDGWRVHPTLPIPSNLPRTKEAPVRDITHAAPSASTEPTRSPEEEARDILATAAKNQAEDGPNARRAAVRACKYLRAMVNGSTIQEVHKAARIHTQMSKGTAGPTFFFRPTPSWLPPGRYTHSIAANR